jgi:hypothetical protein
VRARGRRVARAVRSGVGGAIGRFGVAVVLAFAAACSSSTSGSGGNGAPDDDAGGAEAAPPPTYAPTYTAVWNEILSPSCALVFCHGASGDYLQLANKATGYASLVNAPAAGPMCASTGLLRVDPMHPESSLMYLKVTSPPCGSRMPAEGAGPPLDARQTQQIHDWIAAGALDD